MKKIKTDSKILVIYIGVAAIRSIDIEDYVHKVLSKITPTSFDGEIIGIPVQSVDTRIECINPKYITDEKLIAEHSKLIKNINDELKYQLEQLKNNKNE